MRTLVVLAVVIVGLVAILSMRPNRGDPGSTSDSPQLSYVTTARQLGVVGYRDPAGAISPNGTHFAYAEGRFIRVVPIGGGAPITLPPGEGQIRYLTWSSPDEVVAEDPTPATRWWTYRIGAANRQPLWAGKPIDAGILRQLAWSPDGKWATGLSTTKDGPQVWRIAADASTADVQRVTGRASFPVFTPGGEIACVVDARLAMPCGGTKAIFEPEVDVHGPLAFSKGGTAYFASPSDHGTVELWSVTAGSRYPRRLSSFARDAYAPSVGADGTVVFKVQSYRTTLADVAATGGSTRQLTTFQSETPSYHPTQPLVAFTYGTWRRVLDDSKYPDIAQEIGTIDLTSVIPAARPLDVIAQSESEDQAMTWSPNGKWIAFHTHREMSDDVWLRPADVKQPDKRITFLGRGAEVGWPRWSPDGKTVLLNGARQRDGASVLYTIGVNQDTGAVTSELTEVTVEGIDAEMGHSEWLPGSGSIVSIAKEGPGRHVIFTVPAGGGRATVVHRLQTEHDFSGLGVSPDGKFVAFAAPASDGYYQIFRKAIAGESNPVQLTVDPSNKTQPAWSPDGARIAFTIWNYDATFWSFKEP